MDGESLSSSSFFDSFLLPLPLSFHTHEEGLERGTKKKRWKPRSQTPRLRRGREERNREGERGEREERTWGV